MHKFLRSVGFGRYQKKKEITEMLEKLSQFSGSQIRKIQTGQEAGLCEIRVETAPGMGIVMVGEINEGGKFEREYYFPYLNSQDTSSSADCFIQRHIEKETYAGLLDEYRVGISLIFFMENGFEYKERMLEGRSGRAQSVRLTGLSTEGKVLLPLQKTHKQNKLAKVAARDRKDLVDAAKNGDEEAIETLTIEDIDLYSQISRRLMKEDVYSIVDSSFMPSGIESDEYSIVGEITHVEEKKNCFTDEIIYDLALMCNNMVFHVGIAACDLLGEPKAGRRFKGQIWMQGTVDFADAGNGLE